MVSHPGAWRRGFQAASRRWSLVNGDPSNAQGMPTAGVCVAAATPPVDIPAPRRSGGRDRRTRFTPYRTGWSIPL